MAKTDPAAAGTSSLSHVVIDVEAAASAGDDDEASPCAVCMEPMEWVAVSPCGHREVCVRCAARIRFFHNDRRCCICRSHCATVVVTRASAAARREREGLPFLWPPPPAPAFGGQGLVGVYYWYHRGMGAYFDDVSQYQEMSKVCSTTTTTPPPPPSSTISGEELGVNNNNQQPAASASVNAVDAVNVVSAPARHADDADPLELERSLSRHDKAMLVVLAVVGVFMLGSPLLYLIPT